MRMDFNEEMPVATPMADEVPTDAAAPTAEDSRVPTARTEEAAESMTEAVAEETTAEATEETTAEEAVAEATEETTADEAEEAAAGEAVADGEEIGALGIAGATYAPEDSIPTLGEGELVLSVRNIFKAYKREEYVLRDFSLDVCRGQIVGLLGPNGCGKTTLLKMIAGLLVADRGTIEIAGEMRSELSNLDISYLPERTYFSPGMKVTALLEYFADFYEDFDRALAEEMLFDLDIPMNAKLRTLSKGMKEKVQLVLVMSRKTKLYLLDEPIGGVDPAAREYVLNTILARYNTDATVLITTHLISDIEPVLDSFAFLGYGGELLAYGQAERAREETGKSLDELFREVFRCYRKL